MSSHLERNFLRSSHKFGNPKIRRKALMNNSVCEINRWTVKNSLGEVLGRFNSQTKAIDHANRIQKTEKVIVVIDIRNCEIELMIRDSEEVERAS